MMKSALAAAVLAAGISPFSSAAAAPDSQLVSTFDERVLGDALDDLGLQWRVTERTRDGGVRLLARTEGGFVFYLSSRACDEEGCFGAQLLTVFKEAPLPLEAVNSFNERYVFTSAGVSGRDSVYLSRYFISDYGIPRGNIKANILIFLDIAEALMAEASTSVATVSFDGEAAHTAADSLNRLQAARSARKRLVELGASRHARESNDVEALAGEFTQVLDRTPAAERSKIRNFVK